MAGLWQNRAHGDEARQSLRQQQFPVPGVEPSEVVELDDSRRTRFYCYRR